jgi:hypothetical protein
LDFDTSRISSKLATAQTTPRFSESETQAHGVKPTRHPSLFSFFPQDDRVAKDRVCLPALDSGRDGSPLRLVCYRWRSGSDLGITHRGLLGLVFWLTTAVGLYGLMQWGRWLALAVLWLLVLLTLSPFGEMSTLAMINGEAPPLPIWHELIRYIAPFGITSLFFIEVLYAYRNEFKFLRHMQVAETSRPRNPRRRARGPSGVSRF